MKTVVGLFDDFIQAQRAVEDLVSTGIPRGDISLVANNAGGIYDQYATGAASSAETTGTIIATDATAGAALGGAAGLVMALTGIVIPAFGPIVAAGWLASLLTGAVVGAVTGGLVGALTGAGIPLEDAVYYKEGLRRGGTLVAVRAEDAQAARIAQTLRPHGAVDIEERAALYRREGFSSTPGDGRPAVSETSDAGRHPEFDLPRPQSSEQTPESAGTRGGTEKPSEP